MFGKVSPGDFKIIAKHGRSFEFSVLGFEFLIQNVLFILASPHPPSPSPGGEGAAPLSFFKHFIFHII